ncbi:sphingomyelin synthase-related protein 1-like [Ixodes scapularis]|uniref:sphingomyelin synthase-related protein 1-like n=1 Tax=Ixodes scapularis TaxID=6945 RepID=UPI001A9EFB95|nr:sphingomyelin synthase-related protein 1-like [Ixodes scapularis]
MALMDKPAELWSVDEVSDWLGSVGHDEYAPTFAEHVIDGRALLTIAESDLRKPPLEIKRLGDIKNLMISIRELQWQNLGAVKQLLGPCELLMTATNNSAADPSQSISRRNSTRKHRRRRSVGSSDGTAPSPDISFEYDYEDDDGNELGSAPTKCRHLKPEIWKTAVGMLYFLAVTWITAIVMVIVHDRVPDMQTYPPLPDIFLDNVPHIPWAFAMGELTGLILFGVWVSILICHRHRFILLRRMFSLFGSVFLLRCITMLITSLSVPGKHLECKARHVGDLSEKLHQAFLIWQGGGMLIQGVRTCGDYMFSGHTTVLTLLNFFITEYTPRSYYFLHTTSWVLNLFGIFFILSAHEHYSIDVFIAFYISTRLFLYYHTLANNRALMQMDSKRTRIWFPLFYFFESGVDGIVPNEYDTPVAWVRWFRRKMANIVIRLKLTKVL